MVGGGFAILLFWSLGLLYWMITSVESIELVWFKDWWDSIEYSLREWFGVLYLSGKSLKFLFSRLIQLYLWIGVLSFVVNLSFRLKIFYILCLKSDLYNWFLKSWSWMQAEMRRQRKKQVCNVYALF